MAKKTVKAKQARKPSPEDSRADNKSSKTKNIKKAATAKDAPAEDKTVFVVGIGASAGGLEAIEGFQANTPPDENIAFVIIQHLSPEHKSIMGSLLEKYTTMKIMEIQDGMKIQPNCIPQIQTLQNLDLEKACVPG